MSEDHRRIWSAANRAPARVRDEIFRDETRPIQFSIKSLLALTFVAAMAFWVIRTLESPARYLAVAYLLVGFGQIASSRHTWRSLRNTGEGETDRRDAYELTLSACLFSMLMYLAGLAVLVLRNLEHDPYDAFAVLTLLGMLFQFPAFLANLSAALVYCKELFDRRLAVMWTLNLANSILVFSLLWAGPVV